jgi:hypothetical protein
MDGVGAYLTANLLSPILRRANWSAYSRPPFGVLEEVLAHFDRCMHRPAIASSRLAVIDDDGIATTYKVYRHQGRRSFMWLDPDDFIRRSLLNVLDWRPSHSPLWPPARNDYAEKL